MLRYRDVRNTFPPMEMSVPFPGIDEMRRYAKESFNEEFENDAQMYIDAFRNGAFHEEEPDWYSIAGSLTDEQLANLALSAVRGVVGAHPFEDSEELKTTMKFHAALNKYFGRRITGGPMEILEPLAEFREVLFQELKDPKNRGWAGNSVRGFMLVDLAIHRRMGIHGHNLSSTYDEWIAEGKPIGR